MGKRLNNNPRIATKGLVEDHFCLDLRELLKQGIIVKGQVKIWEPTEDYPFHLTADLDCPDEASMMVNYRGITQKIHVVYRTDKQARSRLFFRDDNGQLTEKIYFIKDQFVSRHQGKLRFKTQFVSQDILVKQAELRAALDAPASTEVRDELVKALIDIEAQVTDRALGYTARYLERRDQRRERRQALLGRIHAADAAMNCRATLSPDQIISRYSELVDGLKSKTLRADASSLASTLLAPCEKPEDIDHEPHLHSDILGRLGLFRRRELTARQIGWPIRWLPQRRRQLHLVVDIRDDDKACAVVIVQTVKKATGKLFWLARRTGPFGRSRYDFECPESGETSSTLIYRDGLVSLIQLSTRQPLLGAEVRLRQLRQTMTPDAPISEEHVAVIKQVLRNRELNAARDGEWPSLALENLMSNLEFRPG